MATDDPSWCRTHLLPRAGRYRTVHIVSADDDNDIAFEAGVDLAAMSLCRHTILSYGTYSFWAGFLANGTRVVPSTVLRGKRRRGGKIEELPPFALTDVGLSYRSDEERRREMFL